MGRIDPQDWFYPWHSFHSQDIFYLGTMAANATTLLIGLVALGAIAWGYVRSRPYGQLGLLAWLQSVLLMAPWLLFFGLFAVGIYLNIAAVLFLFLLATVAYIALGRRMRSLGQNELIRDRLEKTLAADAAQTKTSGDDPTGTSTGNSATDAKTAEGLPNFMPIPSEDLTAIKGIFGIDTFFATETIPYQEGAIFKGNLRGSPQETLDRLQDNLGRASTAGGDALATLYRPYLVNGTDNRPVVVVLPIRSEPKPASKIQWGLAIVLFFAAALTCLERAGLQYSFDLFETPERWTEALPVGLSLFSVVVFHEVAHWVMAQRHNIRLSPAFLIPAWQLGSFGGITRIESVLPDRKTLFDIAIAGPAAGGLLSLGFLFLGLALSPSFGSLPLPSEILQGSLLVGALARTALGDVLQETVVQIHPFVVVGWLGLVITALNLLPAGQLDGGRMVQAIYGRKLAGQATFVSFVLLAIFSLANPVALYWSILVLFLQRQPERPSQNELTEPDDVRAGLCLLMLLLALTVLVPLSPALAGRLGIGVGSLSELSALPF